MTKRGDKDKERAGLIDLAERMKLKLVPTGRKANKKQANLSCGTFGKLRN